MKELANALRALADVVEDLDIRGRGQSTPRLLSYKAAAAYMGVGTARISEWADASEICRIRIGNRVLFDVRELDALADNLERT